MSISGMTGSYDTFLNALICGLRRLCPFVGIGELELGTLLVEEGSRFSALPRGSNAAVE